MSELNQPKSSHAEIKRQYQLMHYLKDNTIEMYDIKNRRKFLNRTRLPQMPHKLLIGTKLSIHARQHCIVDYADQKTRQDHQGLNESTCGIIKSHEHLGKVLTLLAQNDLKVTSLKSVKLSPLHVTQLNLDQSAVIAIEAKGRDAIAKFAEISNGVNCIAAIDADQAKLWVELEIILTR